MEKMEANEKLKLFDTFDLQQIASYITYNGNKL